MPIKTIVAVFCAGLVAIALIVAAILEVNDLAPRLTKTQRMLLIDLYSLAIIGVSAVIAALSVI